MSGGKYRQGVLGIVAIALTLSFAGTNTARAGGFRDALGPLAEEIKQVIVEDQRKSSIQIGEFSGSGHPNCGPGLCEDLKLALNGLQAGICQDQAELKLKGEYEQIQDPRASHLTVLQVAITIRDATGRKVAERQVEVRDTALIATALGTTVYLPPKADREKRNEILQAALKAPSYHTQNTIIRTRKESPYGVEVLVAPVHAAPRNIQEWSRVPARAPINQNGEAFVSIEKGEVYALRIHNNFHIETGVSLTLDGVDAFTFSNFRDNSGQPKFKYFVIRPGGGIIPGWHKTNEYADSFLVTEYGKGASSKMGIPAKGNVGVITVRFALAWMGEVPPEEKGARDGGKETGFGPPVGVKSQEVKRTIGVVRDVVTIRYAR